MNNAGAQNPVQYHFRFQFILILLNLLFLYCTHSSHCSHFFNVTFAFTIVFNLVCLLNETGRMLQYFELLVFLAEIKLVNELNLRSVGNIINFLDDKNLFRLNFILLFSIFYWLFLHCLYRKQVLYWSLVFFQNLLPIQIQGFPGEKNCKNVIGFSWKLSWETWECQEIFFKSPEHPECLSIHFHCSYIILCFTCLI